MYFLIYSFYLFLHFIFFFSFLLLSFNLFDFLQNILCIFIILLFLF